MEICLRQISHSAAHAAHTAHAAAGGAALVVAARRREVARRDDVVDFQDQVRRLGRGGDRLLLRVGRLDDARVGRVNDLAGEHVEPGVLVARLVGRAQVDQQVDRVEARVLGEHAGDQFEGVGERLDGELLAALDGVGVVAQAARDLDLDRAAAGQGAPVGDGRRDDVERVLNAAFEFVDDVVGGAVQEERDTVGVLALDVEQLLVATTIPSIPSLSARRASSSSAFSGE